MTYHEAIQAVYDRATISDIATGMFWYPIAHDIAAESGDVVKGAGIIAALSPRNPWYRNIELARIAFNEIRLFRGTLGNSIKAVNAILDGAHPLEALGGMKTRAFFDNILNPLSSTAVTIDIHAMRIAGVMDRDSPTKRQYHELSAAYSDVAARNGMRPLEMQAITWVTYRREVDIWTHRKD